MEITQNWSVHQFRLSYQHKWHQMHLQTPEQTCTGDYLYFLLLPFIIAEQQKELGRKTKNNKLDMASQDEGMAAFFLPWEAP